MTSGKFFCADSASGDKTEQLLQKFFSQEQKSLSEQVQKTSWGHGKCNRVQQ